MKTISATGDLLVDLLASRSSAGIITVSSTLTLGAAAYEEPIKGDREMETLTQMKCVACRKDAPTVTDAEIAEFHPQVSDWEIVELDGIKRLRRAFSFDDFAQALEFTNKVGELADEEGHHPALMTEWGRTTVTWWTHKIRGLHRNDLVMAAKTDMLYQP
jgi:4a-hydroxytetrahydrobiopterin dehydratase